MRLISNKTYKSFKDTIIELEEIVHKLNEKNREYEKRIEYLYSNEYLQQVLFERDFLQNIVDDYKSRNEKAYNKLETMFDNGNEETILDDLLELKYILQGSDK